MTTFSLEQTFTDGSVATIKRHSILLHLLAAVLVYWLASLLFASLDCPRPGWLALLTMALWLLAPQQTSTVLYSVQRMALLAALLVVLALACYLNGRAQLAEGRRPWLWWTLSAGCVVLAPFAKENGAVALPLILVLEAVVLRGRSRHGDDWPLLRAGAWLLLIAGTLALLAYFFLNLEALERSYQHRSFTLWERLMTQPRVLWDYLLQFYWPDLARMGVYHDDFPVSTSLYAPPATIVVLCAWLILLVLALLGAVLGKARLLAGLVLMFLAAHVIESTFFALEIYFEHRNYLPSIVLALVPPTLIAMAGSRWPQVMSPLLVWCAVPILILAGKTATQVQIWSSPTLLAMHHLNGHPNSVRANTDMASRLASLGEYPAARDLSLAGYNASRSQKAARIERAGDFHLRNIALACLAGVPLPREELDELGKEYPERPVGDANTLGILVKLQSSARCPKFDWNAFADRLGEVYLQEPVPGMASVGVFIALSALLNGLERLEEADSYAQLAMSQAPQLNQLLLMRLHFATALGKVEVAEEMIAVLQVKQAAGELNVGEQQTLALYTEQP